MTTMNAVTLLALSKTFADMAKDARDGVEAGKYTVDESVTLTLAGTVAVSEDTEKTPTCSIPVKEVLALFIARAGFTRDHSIALLKECLGAALSKGVEGVGAVEAAADIDAEFKAAVSDLTASLPKTPVKGKVVVKVAVACVENAAAPAAANTAKSA